MKRLPRGRHGLPDEFVAQNQRERLIDALTVCLHRRGYEKTTVTAIGSTAHVSKSDFYRHFASKDGCFLAAFDDSVDRLREAVRAPCEPGNDWVENVCASLHSLLAYLAREPARANLLLVDGLRGGREMYDRYQEAVRSFVPDLRAGAPAVGGEQPPETTDEAVVGGIASLVGSRVLAGGTEQLADFFPEVAEFALTPYLGAAEARRIISTR